MPEITDKEIDTAIFGVTKKTDTYFTRSGFTIYAKANQDGPYLILFLSSKNSAKSFIMTVTKNEIINYFNTTSYDKEFLPFAVYSLLKKKYEEYTDRGPMIIPVYIKELE